MSYNFNDISVLVVNSTPSTAKMITAALRLQQVRDIYEAYDSGHGFWLFKEHNPDIVITDMDSKRADGLQLARNIRNRFGESPNYKAPVILVTPHSDGFSVPEIRDAGVTELLLVPYSVDSIARCIAYVLHSPRDFIEVEGYVGPDRRRKDDHDYEGPWRRQEDKDAGRQDTATAAPSSPPDVGGAAVSWPDAEDAEDLMRTLFEHYTRHHEIVLRKLKFAQDATLQGIRDAKNDGGDAKVSAFTDYDQMWREIIGLFLESGVSEKDIFKIEKLMTTIPEEIKRHYSRLAEEDEEFTALVESLNSKAYEAARDTVSELETRPNPMSGLMAKDL